jgi:hypothetical protein
MEGNMPNWNSNDITINGPKEKIRALWAAAQAEGSGLLNAMKPMPKELLEGDGWYDWAVANWGTKWDVNMEGLQLIEGVDGCSIVGYADSAWSPPIEAFQAYAAANDDVYMEIKYFEPGIGFVGVWDSEGGDAYWDNVGDLLETTAEEDPVLYDLLDHFAVWGWYEEEEENLEIDLDGGVSAINEN